MIQNGIHFSPILGQNQFELQSRDSSIGLSLPQKLSDASLFFQFSLNLAKLTPNQAASFTEHKQAKLDFPSRFGELDFDAGEKRSLENYFTSSADVIIYTLKT